ncbi:MAG: hypothetical protein ACREV4_03875 [Gammaproteobacteria bacterium]
MFTLKTYGFLLLSMALVLIAASFNASALRKQVGDKVSLDVLRWLGTKERLTVKATLAEELTTGTLPGEMRNPRLGVPDFGDIPSVPPVKVEGVMLYEVEGGSRAGANGLQGGDIVMSVNERPVADLRDFLDLVNREQSALLLYVLRGDIAAFIVAK